MKKFYQIDGQFAGDNTIFIFVLSAKRDCTYSKVLPFTSSFSM